MASGFYGTQEEIWCEYWNTREHSFLGRKKTMKCQIHDNCDKPVVAKIGLPANNAKWACKDGFDEWRKDKEPHNYGQ